VQKNEYLKAALLLNFAGLLWAGNLISGSLLRDYVGPGFIVAARAVVGSVIFMAIIRVAGHRYIPSTVNNWPLVLLMSFTGILGFQTLLYLGLRYTTPINAGLMNALTPLLSVVLAAIFFREKLHRSQWLAGLITALGVMWILSQGQLSAVLSLSFNKGDLFIIAAIVSWCVYGMAGKSVMASMTVLETTAIGLFLSVPPAILIAVVEGLFFIPPKVDGLMLSVLAFVCIGPTVLSLFCWNKGVQLIGPSQAALYLNVIPVYAIILSVVFLEASLEWNDVFGGVLILAGSLYAGYCAVMMQRNPDKPLQ